VALLLLVSTLVDLAGRSTYDRYDDRIREQISMQALITALIDVDCIESSVVLAVIAELTNDEWARSRIESELVGRPARLASCLATLHRSNQGEAWPAARPLVEWVARLLPSGNGEYGHEALLAAIGSFDPDEPWSTPDEYRPWCTPYRQPFSYKQQQLNDLRKVVGGEQALASLDVEPHPDEAFAWEGIEEGVATRVGAVLALCDRFADDKLDTEYRTAFRRFLARVAIKDADLFRRSGESEADEAAAVCWSVGKANNLFGANDTRHMLVRDLMTYFGLYGTAAALGRAMLRAGAFPVQSEVILASPSFLVSEKRRQIINQRDRLEASWD
jgi:hypothetical protein